MVEMRVNAARRSLLSRLVLLPVAATLSACGGGGDSASDAGAASAQMHAGRGAAQPGLVAEPPQTVDVVARGSLLAVGRVPHGGHAVVWQTIDDGTGRAWSLWVQRYGADGMKSGDKTLLLSSTMAPEITGFGMSALVRRDGSIAIAYVVERDAVPGGAQRLLDVRTRLFALDGTPLGSEHVIQSVVAQRTGGMFYSVKLSSTEIAQWDDGDYLVAWKTYPDVPHGAEHPASNVRRVDSTGQARGDVIDVGGAYAGDLRLATLQDGSWLAETFDPLTPSAQQLYAHIVQFDAKHPLELPETRTMPWQSFVLGLAGGGAVLFAGQFGEGSNVLSPYSQWYNPAGKAAGPASPLPGIPDSAIALEDGTFVAFRGEAQRFDKHGRALGMPFQVQGARRIGDALEREGMVLAWMQGQAVMTQRYLAP